MSRDMNEVELTTLEGKLDHQYVVAKVPKDIANKFVRVCNARNESPLRLLDAMVKEQPEGSENLVAWLDFAMRRYIEDYQEECERRAKNILAKANASHELINAFLRHRPTAELEKDLEAAHAALAKLAPSLQVTDSGATNACAEAAREPELRVIELSAAEGREFLSKLIGRAL